MSTLPLKLAHMDGTLSLVALGALDDVFETDVYQLFADPSGVPKGFVFKIRPDRHSFAVFRKTDGAPWVYGSVNSLLNRIAEVLGWLCKLTSS